MVRTAKPKLKGKVAASSSALPPSKATGRIRPKTFKKKAKADPEKQKVAAAEAAVTAEASAPAPPPKPAEVSPAATAAAKKKGVATEAAATAEASAPVPTPKPAEVSPAATAAKNKGVGAGNSGGDQKMSRRAKMKEGEKGDRKKVDEKGRIKKGKKDEKAGEGRSAAGFIFMCSAKTKPECFHSGVFGLPMGMISEVEKIRPGAKLFLYDFDLKLLYGIYKAKTKGGLDLVRSAFHGKFPAQVKFKIDKDCLPLPESKFKHAIKENYNSKGKFTQELSSRQVSRLLELFKPVTIPQPTLHYVEERHRSNASEGHVLPGYVEERRLSRYAEEMHHPRLVEERRLPYDHEERRRSLHVEDICHPRFLEESHATTNSLHDPLRSQHVTSLPELHYVPPTYYRHDVPTFDNRYHQPQVDIMYERSVPRPIGEATDRNPLLPRDYRVLPEEIAARSEDVDELYRSYKIATRAMELRQGPSYVTTAYDDPRSAYSESVQRAVSTRANVPGVPVSSLYSFAGAPAYR